MNLHLVVLEVIDDDSKDLQNVTTVVLCSGKFYYDLIEEKEEKNINDIAFVRIEQLYPFPESQLEELVNKYGKSCNYMGTRRTSKYGPWSYMLGMWKFSQLICCSRHVSGSPASGSPKVHEIRHKEIIDQVMSYSSKNNKEMSVLEMKVPSLVNQPQK